MARRPVSLSDRGSSRGARRDSPSPAGPGGRGRAGRPGRRHCRRSRRGCAPAGVEPGFGSGVVVAPAAAGGAVPWAAEPARAQGGELVRGQSGEGDAAERESEGAGHLQPKSAWGTALASKNDWPGIDVHESPSVPMLLASGRSTIRNTSSATNPATATASRPASRPRAPPRRPPRRRRWRARRARSGDGRRPAGVQSASPARRDEPEGGRQLRSEQCGGRGDAREREQAFWALEGRLTGWPVAGSRGGTLNARAAR